MRMKTVYSDPVFGEKRLTDTINFIENNGMSGPVLVIGHRVKFETELQKEFKEQFDYTDFDLHYPFSTIGDSKEFYKTILCFEVIEHLLNPLLLLTECKKLMRPDAQMYISYPTHNFKVFWTSGHFHEYDKSRFEYLLKVAGLNVVDYREKVGRSKKIGIRPLLKNTPIGWVKYQFYCLAK